MADEVKLESNESEDHINSTSTTGDVHSDLVENSKSSVDVHQDEAKPDKKSVLQMVFCSMEKFIYWRDVRQSALIFGGVLLILLAITYASLISVIAYTSLFVLTGTTAFRIYKNIVQAIQKTRDGHPFKEYLEIDVSLSEDKLQELLKTIVLHLNAAIIELRRLFLVEDLIDSIKFAVLLWVLTYLGSWFNGMTLLILAWVTLFTAPKVYEINQAQIDSSIKLAQTKITEVLAKVKAALPIGKKEGKVE